MSVFIQYNRPPGCAHLAKTSCSTAPPENYQEDNAVCHNKGKKRIGRYSYYLHHLLGSGYGGRVYKGIKDNDKSTWYAIKVIKTKDMKIANTLLLKSEVALMQELDHPNIVKFVEVLYSASHCYLITEYCQGGSLEHYYKEKQSLEWGSIIYQLSQGCQYLASQNIIHRDLKPDNIFLKDGVWKIGDFGFARKISHAGVLIMETYKVGSLLYMPLETLQRNMYSIKSDSFSLGVIIYNLIMKSYPFGGKDINKLMKSLGEKQPNFSKNQFVPEDIKDIVRGLCSKQIKARLNITSIDFTTFLSHKSIDEISYALSKEMEKRVTVQVILCQFINYLMRNCVNILEGDHPLYSLMSNNLYHLTEVFGWSNSSSLSMIMKGFILPQGHTTISENLYQKILKELKAQINIFKVKEDSMLHQVALLKFLEYYQIVEYIMRAETTQLLQLVRSITLHQSFNQLAASQDRISALLSIFEK